MQTLLQDLRFALRQIVRSPGFSVTAILSLTLGIGATIAVYSILYDAVLHPWPYAGADRMAQIWIVDNAGHERFNGLTGPQVRQLRQTPAFEDVVGVDGQNLMVTGGDLPDNVSAVALTGTGFQFMGMPAMLGRYFLPSDAPEGRDPQPVAVLSWKFWQKHYNGDPGVVGKTIQLSHQSYTVIGVMPPRFTWMDGDVYLPLEMKSDQITHYGTIIKLKPGLKTAAADAEIAPLYRQFAKEQANVFPKSFKVSVRLLAETYTSQLKGTMYLLFGAVALLLAIGCGNLSILLLARGTARQHEFAVRAAVGAGGFRIVRQLLTESLLLSVTGAALGVIAAYQIIGLIVVRLPEYSFPHEADFHINLAVLLFSVGLAILTGVLFGLFPSFQFAKPQISQLMQSNMRRVAGSVKGRHIHTTLIAGQIALTLLLLTAAGAAIEGFVRMMRVPLGYSPEHVMSVVIPVRENSYSTLEARKNYFKQLRDKVAEVPGVMIAGISTNATPPDSGFNIPMDILGKAAQESQQTDLELVGAEYFSTLQIPVIEGRFWNASEVDRAAALVVVNRAFVRRYFNGGDALGHSVRVPQSQIPPMILKAPGSDGWLQIIGVVGDSLNAGLEKPVSPAVYAPYTLLMVPFTQILVRSQGDPLALLRGIRRQIASVDPEQQTIGDIRDLEGWIQREPEYARSRLISMLFGGFSGLALVLAAVGLYSVVSYSVAQRTGEFGIRMALGAQRRHVLRIVALSVATSVGIGVAAGLALSFGLNRLIARWVENGAHNPVTVMAASLLLIAVAGLACLIPARRALAVDPMTALRCD
ncbi:MAG TPA: ABC transporter permease [Acidobacteriaceae bacterium]